MDKAPDLPIYQPGNAPGERVETLYYLPGDALQLFVRAVIAQESAPREPAQERQDGRADPLLPGLRARAARFRKALDAICARCKQEKDESPLADELYEIAALALATRDAEIARREGA